MEQNNSNNSYTSIDDLPQNPQNSNRLASENSINIDNNINAMKNSLDFPEEFSREGTNIVMDKASIPSNHVAPEDKVRTPIPDHVLQDYGVSHDADDSRYESYQQSKRVQGHEPILQICVLAGLLYFLMQNPIIQSSIREFMRQFIIICNVDDSLNVLGKVLFSCIFALSLYFIYRFIDVGSLNIVLA